MALTVAEAGADYCQIYSISILVPKLCGRNCNPASTFPRCSFLPFLCYLEHNCIFSIVFCIFLQCTFHFAYSLSPNWKQGKSWSSYFLNFSVRSHLQDGQDGKMMNDFEERDNIILEGIYCIGYFWQPRQISRQSSNVSNACIGQGLLWMILPWLNPFYSLCKLSQVASKHFCKLLNTASQQTIFHNIKYTVFWNVINGSRQQTSNPELYCVLENLVWHRSLKAVVIFAFKNDCLSGELRLWNYNQNSSHDVFTTPTKSSQPADQTQKSFMSCAHVTLFLWKEIFSL